MNILYLTNHLNVGGITSYVLYSASGMKKRGHNVYVASSGGKLLSRFLQEDIKYIPIPIMTKSELSPKILISMFNLMSLFKENKPDIIHSNSRTTQILACLVSRVFHAAHISTCHGFFKNRLSRRLFSSWGDRVIAISEAVKEHLVEDFGVNEEIIDVIHHGINTDKFKPFDPEVRVYNKQSLGLGDGLIIGIIARLSEEKGHPYLIKAMKDVLQEFSDAQLLIIGEGRMRDELVSLTKSLGIDRNVFFFSNAADTKILLSAMDVFVLSSLKEGLGLSLMEAMASGLAVIGSDVGGIKDLIRDGYNGLLVNPADASGLSGAIIKLLKDAEKRKTMGENGRVFIKQNYAHEKMILQTEKLYSICLNLKNQ